MRDEGESDGTSRQSNTHSIESREVRYPWHPWYGRTIWVYESLKKHGRGILRCRIEQDVRVGLLELPEWMFEAAAGGIQLAKTPGVGYEALRDESSSPGISVPVKSRRGSRSSASMLATFRRC